MKFFHADRYQIPLPENHRFPRRKYGLLREALIRQQILAETQILPSPLAQPEDIARAHTAPYVKSVMEGSLTEKEQRRIGLPWSLGLVKRVTATMGGAVASVDAALEDGLSGQLAGGTHHAHADFGSGYCVFNDFAIAALKAIADAQVKRVAIIDLDVHQGDGNAAILNDHPDVFVFSMHGERNFPFRKVDGDLDVDLPDGMGDAAYMQTLADHLPRVFDFKPDLVLYQAGVDGLSADLLGRLELTHEGLAQRDRLILTECRSRHIPVAMAIGGGYADPIELSVQAYVNTYRIAREVYRF